MARKQPLHLWVLDNVLWDYTEGAVCVLAKSELEAWRVFRREDAHAYQRVKREHPSKRFRKINTPTAIVQYGGA